MPFLEQDAFWREAQQEYTANPNPAVPPYQAAAENPFAVLSYPFDGRADHFLTYDANPLLPALTRRAGGDIATLP
jgi:hypothetical protein